MGMSGIAATGPGGGTLLTYIQAWSLWRVHQADADPLNASPQRIDAAFARNPARLPFLLSQEYADAAGRQEQRLLTVLGIEPKRLASGLSSGVSFHAWFWDHPARFEWLHAETERGALVLDELYQLRRCLDQTRSRIAQWGRKPDDRPPPGLPQHLAWLRHHAVSRIRLAEEALFQTDQSLQIYFDPYKRRVFGAIGINESLARFFNLNPASLRSA
jgi:hypothetical protein